MQSSRRASPRGRVASPQKACTPAPAAPRRWCSPSNWHEQGDGHWSVELRCPECEWWGRGSYSQTEVDHYDEELDRGGQELIEDLRALTRANMEDEAERFAGALASDSILPEDF